MSKEPSTEERVQQILDMRDRKVQEHLRQYAPIWLVEEKPIPNEDAVQFNVVFHHPEYNWVNRRYRYDAFTDVLHYKGQRSIAEEDAFTIQNSEPYMTAPIINTRRSYGG
ncbi:MAG: hypothetical protein GYB66_00980 [Chloroflexi bacterium]|nr:hypothetical protein [Chloroflexota bacterium]